MIISIIISRHVTRYPIHETGSNLVIKTSSRCCCWWRTRRRSCYYYIIVQSSYPLTRVKACLSETSCTFSVVCCNAIALMYCYYCHQSASSPLTLVIGLKHATDRTVQHPSVQMLAASPADTGTKRLDRPRGQITRAARWTTSATKHDEVYLQLCHAASKGVCMHSGDTCRLNLIQQSELDQFHNFHTPAAYARSPISFRKNSFILEMKSWHFKFSRFQSFRLWRWSFGKLLLGYMVLYPTRHCSSSNKYVNNCMH